MSGTQVHPAPGLSPAGEGAVEQGGGVEQGASPQPRAHRAGAGGTHRWRRWALAGAVGAAALWWVGWQSPLTTVDRVVVEAPRGISRPDVRHASGITEHDHVPAVDAERVRLAVMTAIPAVADVRVTRSLPGTVRLEVTPRTAVAAVASGRGFYVMDADGVVFDRVDGPPRLPVVRASGDELRQLARTVLLDLPDPLRRSVATISVGSAEDIRLALHDGAQVRWGSAEDAELKARVLAGLRAVKAQRYDVSAPLQPTTAGSPAPR